MFKKVVFLIFSLTLFPVFSYATGSTGVIEIAVSPIKFDIVMNPGESLPQNNYSILEKNVLKQLKK